MSRRRGAAPAGTRARRLATLAPLAAFVLACQGSDPQPLEPVSLDPQGGAESLVDGGAGASVLGYTLTGASGLPVLRLVRHEAAAPGQAVPLGDVVFPGTGRITRLRVGDEAAAVIVGGEVWLVDPTRPSLPTEPIPTPAGALDVAVQGRWVAVAVDHGLVLVDRADPLGTFRHDTASTPAALLATSSGFLAFTTAGYLVADTSGAVPTFLEVDDPVLADLRAGRAAGGVAMVAGPGAVPDRTRLLRLDLTAPAAPAVARGDEVSGALVALAWDGGGCSVVAVHGAGDDASPTSFHQGWLVRESPGAPGHAGLPLSFWSGSDQPLAAHAGHLFAAQAGGVALLRIR